MASAQCDRPTTSYDIKLAQLQPRSMQPSAASTPARCSGVGAYSKHSDFKIKKIHYEVVPLPAAGWLLLAGGWVVSRH